MRFTTKNEIYNKKKKRSEIFHAQIHTFEEMLTCEMQECVFRVSLKNQLIIFVAYPLNNQFITKFFRTNAQNQWLKTYRIMCMTIKKEKK